MKNNIFWKSLAGILLGLLIYICSVWFFKKNECIDTQEKTDYDPRPMFLIDTDVGSDDALAVFLALAAKNKIRVIAITCVYGNTNLKNVETNVLKVLTVANRTDIPVYAGAWLPLLKNYTETYYFGKDGLGDFNFDRPIKGTIDSSQFAASVMVKFAQRYPSQLNIVTIGPVTTLATAMLLDPNFVNNVARFYVMGGGFDKNTDLPDAHPMVEFNFAQDPEADAIVFNKVQLRPDAPLITLVPIDLVQRNALPMKWRLEVLGKLGSEVIEFLNKAERPVLKHRNMWEVADGITLAIAIWPELVTVELEARASIVICRTSQGEVITDSSTSFNKNVRIVQNINVTGFQEKLLRYLA